MQPPLNPEPDEGLLSALESLLLVSGGPASFASLAEAIGISQREVEGGLAELARCLTRGIRLQIHEGQAQIVTAPENSEVVHRFLGTSRPAPLSRPALEALAVVAYRQPVTRAEVEAARGVNSDRAMQTLLARGLIEERGRREVPGRPAEYGTTFAFLEYFGLASLDDLPPFSEEVEDAAPPVQVGFRGIDDDDAKGGQASA